MNNKPPSRMTPFIIGLILGMLGTIYLPGYVRPYLPTWLVGKTTVVKGIVMAKQKKDNVLLLTVSTAQGELLATFKKKVDEITLLVNENDVIEFTLPKYMPFIEDPKIIRIVKELGEEPEQAPPQPGQPVQPPPKKEGGGKKEGPPAH